MTSTADPLPAEPDRDGRACFPERRDEARRVFTADAFFERVFFRTFGAVFFARTEAELRTDFCLVRPSEELGRAKAKVAARRAAGITGTFRTLGIIETGSGAGQAKRAEPGIFFMLMRHMDRESGVGRLQALSR
jgi:hypothetical protein